MYVFYYLLTTILQEILFWSSKSGMVDRLLYLVNALIFSVVFLIVGKNNEVKKLRIYLYK